MGGLASGDGAGGEVEMIPPGGWPCPPLPPLPISLCGGRWRCLDPAPDDVGVCSNSLFRHGTGKGPFSGRGRKVLPMLCDGFS